MYDKMIEKHLKTFSDHIFSKENKKLVGFIEAGTVTAQEQPGNPFRPRVWRLPKDRALINALGFNNEGTKKVAGRIGKTPELTIPLGISIGKSMAGWHHYL